MTTFRSRSMLKCLLALIVGLGVSGVLAAGPVAGAEQGVLTVVAKVYPKAGKDADVEALLLKMATAVQKAEPDCIIYRPHKSTKAPTSHMWYEQYRSDAAFEAHRTAPHLAEYRKQLGTLLEKPTEVDVYRSLMK